jgi:LacI family transcriptional regulator
VAEAAGVALSSASRVLSDHPDVSPAMRERVMAAVEELGYEPNLLWHGLRRGTTDTIGFIHRDISSPLVALIAKAAEETLQDKGYSMLLSNTRGQRELDVSQIRLLDQRRVDGMLVSPNDIEDPRTHDALGRLRVPFVAIDREVPSGLGGGAVFVDHARGARAAAKDLAKLGHRAIGFVAPPAHLRPSSEVDRALREVMNGVGGRVVTETGPFSAEHGAAATARLLADDDPVTAIIAGSNQIVPGVLTELRDQGVLLPTDVSVVAVEDLPLLSLLDPPISVISREPDKVGTQAAGLLLEMLDGAPPDVRSVPTLYVARGSTGPPRATRRPRKRAAARRR